MKTPILPCLFLAFSSLAFASSQDELCKELAGTERSFCADVARIGIDVIPPLRAA